MSLEAVSAVLHHSQATGTDKVVLIGVAWHLGIDPEEGCWPRVATLAKYAGVNTRSVRRSLNNLVASGELSRYINAGPGKEDQRPNCYYLHVNCPPECDNTLTHKPRKLSTGRS